ncbi:MAG TPA: tRNA pseudouridine(55) synthase TruB [Candidatus Limnocylindrales bacterium]|nr:tRNA pseudouridine(55) synthase TruB [Candidatus Limnocylindrales bacterium]
MNGREQEPPSGVLAIDKPAGWTSFDVVAVARRTLAIRRVGHGGTLDPAATGLLPILVGTGTKFFDRMHEAPKVYAALVRFGSETDTDDREGKVTRVAPPPLHTDAEATLAAFRGTITQVPPDYAAVKVAGRRAYDRARAGEALALAAREVQVLRLDVTRWSSDTDLGLLVVCTSGTYIRSIARDLGRACASAAHLGALRRLAVGALDVRDATAIDDLRRGGHDAALSRVRPVGDDVLMLHPRYLTESTAALVPQETHA